MSTPVTFESVADRIRNVMLNLETSSVSEITLALSRAVSDMTQLQQISRRDAISDYVQQIHQWAVEKGWWQKERDLLHQVALHHTELSEVVEEYRKYGDVDVHYEGLKPCGVPSEFADTLVRIFDTCGYYGIDLGAILEEKIAYNAQREMRHGGKHA